MSPEMLVELLTSLNRAADVVEAIDDHLLQDWRGWDLSRWDYELIPWGVRFTHQEPDTPAQTEIRAWMPFENARTGPGHPFLQVRCRKDPKHTDSREQGG